MYAIMQCITLTDNYDDYHSCKSCINIYKDIQCTSTSTYE